MIVEDTGDKVIGWVETIYGMFGFEIERDDYNNSNLKLSSLQIDTSFYNLICSEDENNSKSEFLTSVMRLPTNVEAFPLALQHLLNEIVCKTTRNNRDIHTLSDKITTQNWQQLILEHLNGLGWQYIERLNANFTQSQVYLDIDQANSERHKITIELTEKYPYEPPKVNSSLLLAPRLDWNENCDLVYLWRLYSNQLVVLGPLMKVSYC